MRDVASLSRRNFIKACMLGAGAILLPWNGKWGEVFADSWKPGQKLGRVCVSKVSIRSKPSALSTSVGELVEDDIVEWLHEVVGDVPDYRISRRWVETPKGFVYAPSLQPTFYNPNQPLNEVPASATQKGFWAEVTTPFVDVRLETYPPAGYWLKDNLSPRLYYSQVVWIDDLKLNAEGQPVYRVNERYGSRGDKIWGAAESFRPISPEEIAPITPDVADKKIIVNLKQESLSCFEGTSEVYYCRVSAGIDFDDQGNPSDKSKTPVGAHPIWRKLVSIHMEGGNAGGGYDLPGVAWTCLFVGEGVAIHSTFWHNDFGTKRSHGCVNVAPDDAKWIWRWTTPNVAYDPGDMIVQMPGGTTVEVVES